MSDKAAELLPFEAWAERKKVPAWKLSATRAHENWPAGREVTEADFARALHQACNVALK